MEGRGGGHRDGRESLGVEGEEGKGVGKREGKFRGGGKYFFLEPRLVRGTNNKSSIAAGSIV